MKPKTEWLNELVGEAVAPAALAIGAVALFLSLVTPLVVPDENGMTLARNGLLVALANGAIWLAVRVRGAPPPHLVHPIGFAIACTVLAGTAAFFVLIPEPQHVTTLMLTAIGAGGLIASRRWLAAHLAAALAVFAVGALRSPTDPQWVTFGFALAFAFVLSVLFHEVRMRMLARLYASRSAIARELAERERAETALRESESRFREIFELAPVMMHSLDVDGRVLAVNQHWLSETGWQRDDVVGRSITAVLTPESAERIVREALPRLWREGELRDLDLRVVRRDRSAFDVHLDARVLEGADGVRRDLTVLRNVSATKRAAAERERLRQHLFEARKLESLGLLAGGIAHDFNNLLAAILGNAHLAIEGLAPGSAEHDAVSDLRDAAERGALLTRQLLSYAGRAPTERMPLDLSEQIRDVARIVQHGLATSVATRFDLADSLPAVEADPGQLQQVIMNLVRNAADALGPDGGEITVRTGLARLERAELAGLVAGAGLEPGLYVHFDICDDGCGMDAETRDRLFDPFFTRKASGHGLGLPVALGVVRAHGGGIAVETAPGAGTSFRVYLPASSRAPVATAAVEPTELRGSGCVLLADDEPSVRRVARRILERFGYAVLEASDGDSAVACARESGVRFVAALLDLRMPGGGIEAARALRVLDPELPVLIQSGFDPDGAIERLGLDGPVGFLAKPFTPQALATALRAVVAKGGRKPDAE